MTPFASQCILWSLVIAAFVSGGWLIPALAGAAWHWNNRRGNRLVREAVEKASGK